MRLFNETKEALEQQTAISEILRVISSSPGDVRPMLEAVAERSLRLCDASQCAIFLVEGDSLRFATGYGTMSTPREGERWPLSQSLVICRATRDRRTISHADIVPLLDTEYPDARPTQAKYGFRAIMCVPLMREDRAIGVFALWRNEPRAFSAKQIALVETFAGQAAIGIENVRLFNETKEALEQQTAISDILHTISSSPTDVKPVLDAVAKRAAQLCDAPYRARAARRGRPACSPGVRLLAVDEEPLAQPPGRIPLKRTVLTGRAALDRVTIHHADVVPLLDAEYPDSQASVVPLGARAVLSVPLMREGGAYGGIFLFRREPVQFSPSQVALVQTFARQAAIAIDNVRLFNQTREALEQQTAISDILRVISGSPTDVQPVLDAIAERSARLCDAAATSIYLIEGGVLRHLASQGPNAEPVNHAETIPVDRGSVSGRALADLATISIPDMLAVRAEYPVSYEIAVRLQHRSVVVTPLFREGKAFGIILMRRDEVRPFTEREIGLLRTFGDQAAIAIENVRLFNETKEALDQQRASGEVLTAISNSIADTKPVFDVILQSCQRLFAGETVGLTLVRDDGMLDIGAYAGSGGDALRGLFPQPLNRETLVGHRDPRATPADLCRHRHRRHAAALARRLPRRRHAVDVVRADAVRGPRHRLAVGGPRISKGHSPTSSSHSSRLSPTRRSSRSRTPACSTRRRRRSSSSGRPARCWRRSAARSPTPRPCSRRSSKAASGCSTAGSGRSTWSTSQAMAAACAPTTGRSPEAKWRGSCTLPLARHARPAIAIQRRAVVHYPDMDRDEQRAGARARRSA